MVLKYTGICTQKKAQLLVTTPTPSQSLET